MIHTTGWGATAPGGPLEPMDVPRRDPGPGDVVIDILYCGVCHTDIHQVDDDWGNSHYPMVPGHEIVGRVREVRSGSGDLAPGDLVGVGCMVGSCGDCPSCSEGLEQYCARGPVLTYNSKDPATGQITLGGYSGTIVVSEGFVLPLPEGLDPAGTAPLLCAGITVYSPLRRHGAGPGTRVGVIGIGGLGHLGLRMASALGAETVAITSSPDKRDDALRLGADDVLVSTDREAMGRWSGGFDLLLSTIGTPHDLNPYLELLRRDGTYSLMGALGPTPPVVGVLLAGRRAALTSSMFGGIAETREMLDFCARHGITAEVETVPVERIGEAFARTAAKKARYRFVLDLTSARGNAGAP
ncbi:NAD(P)-dependent alcohol dehydrogenase [Nocardiopsis sp. JB363]|uniref:NAD(P)-dependent alcohol dehydrogenase n=1 Tax=Nocardiopsis sp. JB363 TaxID=1434837 RepID=UPI000B35BDAA|nr:NAD(P)-dependent alcohol dehydrogenase [Nocardiopsis sp. JB363]